VISIVVEIMYRFIFYGFLGDKLQLIAIEKPQKMKLLLMLNASINKVFPLF
jgi:hypothetical protein